MCVARNWIAWMLACCGIRVEAEGLENLSEPVVIVDRSNRAKSVESLRRAAEPLPQAGATRPS
jgi:hypothetical protein